MHSHQWTSAEMSSLYNLPFPANHSLETVNPLENQFEEPKMPPPEIYPSLYKILTAPRGKVRGVFFCRAIDSPRRVVDQHTTPWRSCAVAHSRVHEPCRHDLQPRIRSRIRDHCNLHGARSYIYSVLTRLHRTPNSESTFRWQSSAWSWSWFWFWTAACRVPRAWPSTCIDTRHSTMYAKTMVHCICTVAQSTLHLMLLLPILSPTLTLSQPR